MAACYVKYESVFAKKQPTSITWVPGTVMAVCEDATLDIAFDDGSMGFGVCGWLVASRHKKVHPSPPCIQKKIAQLFVADLMNKTITEDSVSAVEWDHAIIAEIDIVSECVVVVPSSWFPTCKKSWTMQLQAYKWDERKNAWKYDVAYRENGTKMIDQYGFVPSSAYVKAKALQHYTK